MHSPDPATLKQQRVILIIATLATTLAMAWLYAQSSSWITSSLIGGASLALFTALTGWVAFGFWTAMLGLRWYVTAPHVLDIPGPRSVDDDAIRPIGMASDDEPSRVALVVPIYNEDPAAVFACVQASAESLAKTDQANRFEFFILSDTTQPDCWLREEILWTEVRRTLPPGAPAVHYRHRVDNHGRKEGNIAEFLERWGLDYRYFLILDADSTMDGRTLTEMVRRMDADPWLGILQAPPIPEGGASLWARLQQFSARVYGPLFMAGFDAWAGIDGNYWGHNAIIRTLPFLRHCGLSKLPGREPLGGQVLSHDFVEAALMRRAGYHVRLAADLGGGYEQCPTTVEDHARRDQRWCQGNLQHLRIAVAPAFRPISRLHLLSGAVSYLASPIWLLFLLLSFVGVFQTGVALDSTVAVLTFALVMTMLILPKLLATAAVIYRGSSAFGGPLRLAISTLIEITTSVLIAPLMMLYHTRFVVLNLIGRKVHWNSQQRASRGVRWSGAIQSHGRQMLIGLTAVAGLWLVAPGLLWWASPLLAGLCLAIPLAKLMASPTLGLGLRQMKLLATPEETATPKVLRRRRVLQRQYEERASSLEMQRMFAETITNPSRYRLHQCLLAASQPPPATVLETPPRLSKRKIRRSCKTLQQKGIEAIPASDHRTLLSSPDAMRQLHHTYWANHALSVL